MKSSKELRSFPSKRKQTKLSTAVRRTHRGYDINQFDTMKGTSQIVVSLQQLITLFPQLPTLLSGSLRHLKVEPHYREPTSRLWLSPQTYRKTSKIRLTGNWIEKAGFICHERIRVIPMHRMLIIVPETGCTNEHESETNGHE